MPRSTSAYLADIVDACDAVAEALAGVDLEAYRARRLIRSAVEREFTVIGEAIGVLGRRDPALATRDAPVLRAECAALVEQRGDAD